MMGTVVSYKEEKYSGRVYEAKDNMVIETRTGPDSVSLSAPIDFIDSMLSDYVNQEVKVTISVKIEKL
jgi:predicted FMN-binding regulatory protein PaiB